jgi:hypothetical protein
MERSSTSNQRRRLPWQAAVVVAVFVATSIPLIVGLDRQDIENDEAIYSFAVERILETGEWLTPRSLPSDTAFLEKPPLKFWLVAAPMVAGLTPNSEAGMRVVDVIFGIAAFGYVALMGWRLGGMVASVVSMLVLLSFSPLVFQHGLRSNNMEGALVLAYSAGVYHLLRWRESANTSARHLHAFALALCFVLGFMTKFVAIGFLPMVAVAWLLTESGGVERLRTGWRDWILPSLLALGLIAPWFVYQTVRDGAAFWDTIFGQHVFVRLTAHLDPAHLAPWHFYFTQTWREFALNETAWLVAAGLVALVWASARGHSVARLVLGWWLIPFAIMSLGSSKLLHYAYPFIAPLALGAGLAASLMIGAASDLAGRIDWRRFALRAAERPAVRRTLWAAVVVGLLLWAWVYVTGQPVRVVIGETMVFRNGSVFRPFVIAILALLALGYGRQACVAIASLIVAFALPTTLHARSIHRALTWDRPLREASDCMLDLQHRGERAAGVYISNWDMVSHPPYYYFRHVGPWTYGPDGWLDVVSERMRQEAPAMISDTEWPALRARLHADGTRLPSAVHPGQTTVLLLLPGPYAECTPRILASGGRAFPRDDITLDR